MGADAVQWDGMVWVVFFHFSAWAWARRGATEGARRSEWRVWSVVGSVIVFFFVVLVGGGCVVCVLLYIDARKEVRIRRTQTRKTAVEQEKSVVRCIPLSKTVESSRRAMSYKALPGSGGGG